MPQVLTRLELQSILERIGKALQVDHDKVTKEQLPSRWVDLIHHLDDKERQQSDARSKTEPPPEY
jgi:hypothetical protein